MPKYLVEYSETRFFSLEVEVEDTGDEDDNIASANEKAWNVADADDLWRYCNESFDTQRTN